MKAIKFSLFKLDPDNTWAAVEEALHLLDMCDDDDDYKQRSIFYFLTDIDFFQKSSHTCLIKLNRKSYF